MLKRIDFYEFGEFRLNPNTRVLWHCEEVIPLTDKRYDLLLSLLSRQGAVIETEILIQELWPETKDVQLETLRRHVSDLRKILKRHPTDDEFIVGVRGRGYRMGVPVRTVLSDNTGSSLPTAAAEDSRKGPEVFAAQTLRLGNSGAAVRRSVLGIGLSLLVVIATGILLIIKTPQATVQEKPFGPSWRLFGEATSEGGQLRVGRILSIPGTLLLSPDGRRLYAIEDRGRQVDVLDGLSLSKQSSLRLPSAISRAVITRDGRYIYCGSLTDGVIVIDTVNHSARALRVSTGGPVMDLDVSFDGKTAFLAMEMKGLKELNLRTLDLTTISNEVAAKFVKVHPRGDHLYVSYQDGGPGGRPGHDALAVYDLRTKAQFSGLTHVPRVGGPIAFSSGGEQVLLDELDACSGTSYDHEGCPFTPARLFHIASRVGLRIIKTVAVPEKSFASTVFFAPDGRQLIFGEDSLAVFDLYRQKIVEQFAAPGQTYSQVTFSPDASRVYVSLANRPEVLMFRPTGPRCTGPEEGLANLYTGDGSFDDGVAGGVVIPRGAVHFSRGFAGQAFQFGPDRNSMLEIRPMDACYYCGDEWTVSFFLKFSSLEGAGTILKRAGSQTRFGYRLVTTTGNRLALELDQGNATFAALESQFPLVVQRWYQLHLVFGGRSIEGFLDGVSFGRITLEAPMRKEGWGAVYVGGEPGRAGMAGLIDELAFYSRAQTSVDFRYSRVGSKEGCQAP